jgi:hypothetical protein
VLALSRNGILWFAVFIPLTELFFDLTNFVFLEGTSVFHKRKSTLREAAFIKRVIKNIHQVRCLIPLIFQAFCRLLFEHFSLKQDMWHVWGRGEVHTGL